MHKTYHTLATAALLVWGLTTSTTAGTVLQLYYDGIPGTTVSSLTTSGFFPASPTDYDVLVGNLEKGAFGDNYGSWTRGFLEAPQTGSYLFWIASDDDSEFWLSTDHTPANRVKRAENVGAVGFREYSVKPAQQSTAVNLVRGQKYYFEILHKEGTGDDHVSVGWQLPDGTLERPIPGARLMPFPVDANYTPQDKAPQILTDYFFALVPQLDAVTSVEESRSVTLAVTIEATQPASLQWFSNNVAIPDAILSTYTIASVPLSANNAEYRVEVSNALGGPVSASTVLQVSADVTPPVLLSALNLGRTVGSVVVVFSEPVEPVSATTAGNYSLDNGATISEAVMGSKPGTVILKTSPLVAGTTYTLTVSNVKDASVAQHVIAPNSTATLDDQMFFWLGFDEGSSATATDASGNGHNGTMANGATAVFSGKIHGAAGFDGIDDHTVVSGTGFDDWTGGMTVAAWLRPANIANWSRIIDFSNGAANDNILFARSGTSSGITFEVYNGGVTGGKVTANGVIQLNHWQHFAATMDAAGFVKIYKDGVVIATGTTAVPNLVARANNYVARSAWSGDGYYGGRMDDVRVYKRVLSDEEITAISGGDPSLPEVSLVATIPTASEEGTVPGEITATRTGSTTGALTVNYLISGTAENGVDYVALPGSVTIPIGASTAAIAVTPIDDAVLDPVETVILTLTGDASYQAGASESGTVTILDNEDNFPPTVVAVTVDNELPTFATTRVDVWFDEPVQAGQATTVGNYVFSQAGVTINSATLDARSRRVLLALSGPLDDGGTLTVSNVQDLGGNAMGTVVRPIQSRLTPVNVIANSYNSPVPRDQVFALTSNGVVDNTANAGGWDTFSSARRDLTHFVGMLYPNAELFNVVKVDLGIQFVDGGSWASQPRVFILKNQVDPIPGQPELDPFNWLEVPAQLISGSLFDPAGDGSPSPNTPITFDLSNVPAADRTGYGWAVGGAQGDNSLQFLSITETRGYGVAAPNRPIQIQTHPQDRVALQGQEVTFSVVASGSWPISYQWLLNDVEIPGATAAVYTTSPLTLGDTASQYKVIVTNPEGSVTSNAGSLTVNADNVPPQVVVVTVDTAINVWFNEAVAPASATTVGNYTLSEAGVTITGATELGTYGRGVALEISQPLGANPVTLSVANVQDLFGNAIAAPVVVPVERRLPPVNVVGFNYNSPTVRNDCFILSNNDIVDNINNAGGWDTWASRDIGTRFSGMLYGANQLFSAIKVDLGRQFGDGGNYAQSPKVFLLKNNVDTDRARPETDINWVEVPAHLVSASQFDPAADPTGEVSPSTPIVFSLNHLPAGQRTGYGWAVGGVQGDGSITFTSLSELRAYGVPAPSVEPPLEIALAGNNLVISWPAEAVGFVLKTTINLTSPSWSTVSETPQLVGDRLVVTLPVSGNSGYYRLEQ
ncbi:MAG: Ig-like domain-containing protein [Verrucomicrobiae bacterium]|nr:Ig-like domain-containing protein [Verrucomicrobiae bacterium]